MKIISNFSDFYDSTLAHGFDEKIVYQRVCKYNGPAFDFNKYKDILANNAFLEVSEEEKQLIDLGLFEDFEKSFALDRLFSFGFDNKNNPPFYHLVINSALINCKPYMCYMVCDPDNKILIKSPDAQEIFNFAKNLDTEKFIDKRSFSSAHSYAKEMLKLNYNDFVKKKFFYYGSYNKTKKNVFKEFAFIHQKFNSPVIILSYQNTKISIYKDCPLKAFGFSYLEPNQIAQEISFCLANIISDKNQPPIKISDQDRLLAHGFDKKLSFRGKNN